MTNEKIEKSVDSIRAECDKIEDEVVPKKASTYGDPIVEFH